jgi:hypothetical protein
MDAHFSEAAIFFPLLAMNFLLTSWNIDFSLGVKQIDFLPICLTYERWPSLFVTAATASANLFHLLYTCDLLVRSQVSPVRGMIGKTARSSEQGPDPPQHTHFTPDYAWLISFYT